jgi:hypothetical protein
MVDMPITLSALWIALMLTYLLGDVLRIYSGDIAARIGIYGGGCGIIIDLCLRLFWPQNYIFPHPGRELSRARAWWSG